MKHLLPILVLLILTSSSRAVTMAYTMTAYDTVPGGQKIFDFQIVAEVPTDNHRIMLEHILGANTHAYIGLPTPILIPMTISFIRIRTEVTGVPFGPYDIVATGNYEGNTVSFVNNPTGVYVDISGPNTPAPYSFYSPFQGQWHIPDSGSTMALLTLGLGFIAVVRRRASAQSR